MIKRILTITLFFVLVLNSCTEKAKKENGKLSETEVDDIVTKTYLDKDKNKLEIEYNSTKGIATLVYDGETVNLEEQKSASGFLFKNKNYELIGKANNIELKKDDKIVFSHEDDIIMSSLKNEDGQTLNITMNNTAGTAKVYINGGEQIDLVKEKVDSGICFKNDTYELKGKEENLVLTKNGKVVFKK